MCYFVNAKADIKAIPDKAMENGKSKNCCINFSHYIRFFTIDYIYLTIFKLIEYRYPIIRAV